MTIPEQAPVPRRETIHHRDLVIAMDGSTTAGKRLVGERLANRYDLTVLDTGKTIRALALLAIEHGIVMTDESNITTVPADFISQVLSMYDGMEQKITIAKPREGERISRVKVGERDMWGEILAYRKQKAIDNVSSIIASSTEVRERLYGVWRDAAREFGGVVVIGRRTGIDLFPDAQVKIYLYASPEASAAYRVLHDPTATLHRSTEERYVRERDGVDRAKGLLERSDDALVIDTSDYITNDSKGFEELDTKIASYIDARYHIT